MSSRMEELARIHATGCYMQEKDLAELYSYLLLFAKTYLCGRDAAQSLLETVRQVYSLEYACTDPVQALRRLNNPRNAGRKPLRSESVVAEVKLLYKDGFSIRSISDQTGIPKSTVQRMLHL